MTTPLNSSSAYNLSRVVFPGRIIAFICGSIAVLPYLLEAQSSLLLWAYYMFTGLIWPMIAGWRTISSSQPMATESNNMALDCLVIGTWLAVIGYAPLTSVIFMTGNFSANIAVLGSKNVPRSLLFIVLGAIIGSTIYPPVINMRLDWTVVIALIPLAVVFPIVIAVGTNKITLQLIRKRKQLLMLTQRDSLTGLLSREHWHTSARGLLDLCERLQQPASVMLMDIDHFKSVNDTYGHTVGDTALRSVAELIQNNMRQSDIAGRYGGEEFAVLLPNTDLPGALYLAEQIRQNIASTTVDEATSLRCTISIGVVTTHHTVETLQEWIRRADKALYKAKDLGRNRVVAYEEVEPVPEQLSVVDRL